MIPEQPEVCDCSGSCAKVATVPDLASLLLRDHTAPWAPERAETPGRRAAPSVRASGRGGAVPAGGRARARAGCCGARRAAALGVRGVPCSRTPDPPDQSVDADAAPAARAAARRRGGIRARGQVSARVCILCTAAPVRALPLPAAADALL